MKELSQLHFESNPPLLVSELKERSTDLYSVVLSVYRKTKDILDTRVSQVFPDYTLHNVNHSLRIINYMGEIIPSIEQLSDLEITFLICSALLHDIGMGATSSEVERIKSGELSYKDFSYEAFLKKFKNDHTKAVQDYIRRVHALRSAEYIKKELKDVLIVPTMPNTNFDEEVSKICQSHTEDISWIEKNLTTYSLKGSYKINLQFCAMVLRLADLLDFDSERTPPSLYKVLEPTGVSDQEWKQHFSIDNSNKITLDSTKGYKIIELFGKCSNSIIHRKILKYLDWINDEIENINKVTSKMENHYVVNFKSQVRNEIQSEGYTFADLRFIIDFRQITNLLMGEQIYGDKKNGLRELIQNSIDACKTRKEIEDKHREFGDEEYEPVVKVILDQDKNQVIISDNGSGMNIEILKNYFLNVGSSYYTSDDYMLKGLNHKPIGNYGIGFLACFMLSDLVTVKTRHFENSTRYEVELAKEDEYVSIKESEDVKHFGTDIILKFDQFMQVWPEGMKEIQEYLELYFLSDEVSIELVDKASKTKKTISNSLVSIKQDVGQKDTIIDLSEFLDGVTGEVIVKNPNNILFNYSFNDISLLGEPYYYNEEMINLEDSEIKILSLVRDGKLKVVNIPIIEHGERLERLIEAFNNVKEGIEHYMEKNNFDYITILAPPEKIETAYKGTISYDDEIMDGLEFKVLYNYGQDRMCDHCLVDIGLFNLFSLPGNSAFLELVDRSPDEFRYFRSKDSHDFRLYVKGVYVKSFKIVLEKMLYDLKFENFKVNIVKDNIIPNVSRDGIQEEIENNISTAIYQAICIGVYQKIEDIVEKETLLQYIKQFKNTETIFMKEKYKNLIN
ncbi:HD domain-containing protein [Paenibacillus sp. AD87]|uniref:HD domain-containing protein n=1 Tax=Paenibacillus sp. AD87 TaxID=1528787 RepID=UPI0007E3CEA6|nr:ATP-binding protein [Paenibacillus sp. AD87]OAX49891.1 Chaperone protein HtpG [Paenibacillus sp. AD87]